ncbi:MAG TPA: ECF-type sigma factor [Urbifossiella sp.]|nr:ECF-type sigma factor [Urbifossiella sp.]
MVRPKWLINGRAEYNLVKLRYFAGMSLAEAAAALGLSERTAGRHWAYARAWLRRAVEGSPDDGA